MMFLACLLACLLEDPAALAQQPAPVASTRAEQTRLAAWPELDKSSKEVLALALEKLRKARTPEMGQQGQSGLIALGAGAVPELLRALGKEADASASARLRAVLEALTTAAHTRLLAREFGAKSPRVRLFALERAAAFPDAGLRAEAERALDQARAAQLKPGAEPDEPYFAALAATSTGSLAGMDVLLEAAREQWAARGPAMRVALEAVRSSEATRRVAPELAQAERARKLAALHLLAGCGDRSEACALLKPVLDDEDNGLRIAAINALRGIVDGAPPLERLPVFEAIELAKAWKARL